MIDFELRPEVSKSETQRMVYEAARDFAIQFIKPNVMDWDEAQYFPVEIFEKAGALGFMGMLIPERYGGCLLYTSPSPRDATLSRMPSSA